MARKAERWFVAGMPLGWRKADKQAKRRRIALRNRDGDLLATARALTALANVNSGRRGDEETHRKARSDAGYFYREYEKQKRRKR